MYVAIKMMKRKEILSRMKYVYGTNNQDNVKTGLQNCIQMSLGVAQCNLTTLSIQNTTMTIVVALKSEKSVCHVLYTCVFLKEFCCQCEIKQTHLGGS